MLRELILAGHFGRIHYVVGFSWMVISNYTFLVAFFRQGNKVLFVQVNDSQVVNSRQSFIAVPKKRQWDLVSW